MQPHENYSPQTAKRPQVSDTPRPTATIETITPEKARDWWSNRRRTINRTLDKGHIRRYSRDMKSGRWILNNDAISFDTQGFLLNGHHRLKACIDSGVSFDSFVHWNVPDMSFITMDVNAKRQMADTLELNGVELPRLIGPALNLWARFHEGSLLKATDASYEEQRLLYETSREEIDKAAAFISSLKLSSTMTPSMALFCFLLFSRHDRTLADQFFRGLATGAIGTDENHPVLQFRETLMRSKRDKSLRLTGNEILALAIKAWDLLVSGKTIKRFYLNKDEMKKLLTSAPLLFGSAVGSA